MTTAAERKQQQHHEMRALILDTARVLMGEHGTAGLSIRLVARAVDMSPAALYYYFPNLDAIITALIVAGYRDLAIALENAAAGHDGVAALDAIAHAYRTWALARPTDFQLLFGTPIPGYEAPREQTVPEAVRVFIAVIGAARRALECGALTPSPAALAVPPSIDAHLQQLIRGGDFVVTPEAMLIGTSFLALLHGAVMLELMGHIGPTMGDSSAFYDVQVAAWMRAFGSAPGP